MKKVFSSHSECAHVWAQQKQDSGKSANMFFEGTRIFSYGHHYCIANFINPNLVLINSKGYSNSTSKHHNHVNRALSSNIKTFIVPSLGWSKYDYQNEIDHAQNIEYFKLKINNLVFDSKKAIKNTSLLINQANYFKYQGLDYCIDFNLPERTYFETLITITDEINAKIESQKEKEGLRKQIEEIENNTLIDFCKNEVLPAWFNNSVLPKLTRQSGKNVVYKTVLPNILPNAYLRLRDNEVETSQGAKVPLKASKVLFEMIKQGRDIKGYQIGNYTVISLNGVLTIGCHKIERTEINRFASLMGWGQIELH